MMEITGDIDIRTNHVTVTDGSHRTDVALDSVTVRIPDGGEATCAWCQQPPGPNGLTWWHAVWSYEENRQTVSEGFHEDCYEQWRQSRATAEE